MKQTGSEPVFRKRGSFGRVTKPSIEFGENKNMSVSKPYRRFSPAAVLKCAVTFLSVGSATALAGVLWHYWHCEAFASLFFCAIMVSAWAGGFWQVLLAVALSVLAFDYYFLPPFHSFYVESGQVTRLVIFAISGLVLGMVTASQRTITKSLRRTRDVLTATIRELGRTNEALHSENTERKLAEIELRQTKSFLSEAQRLSRTGGFVWRIATGEILWSEETFRIFQCDPTLKPTVELILQRVHPDDIAPWLQTAAVAAQAGRDFEHEYRLIMPDGAIKHLHVLARAERSESGASEFVGAIMDITERKRAEEALRQVQAEITHMTRITTMGELTASIAHEVNQPLTAVVNNANACIGLLPKGASHFEEIRQALMEIIEDADRASSVVARIRELARKTPVKEALLDLRNVVNDVLALARHESAARQITIYVELAADLPAVLGDRVQLQQVLLNLMVNGMDAMNSIEASKRVLVIYGRRQTDEGRPEALIGVQDAGTGIKPDEMNRLFAAFYTTKPHGMGMGLAISRSIIKAHGGRLWADPTPGPGATFLFSLPAADHFQPLTEAPSSSPEGGHRGTEGG